MERTPCCPLELHRRGSPGPRRQTNPPDGRIRDPELTLFVDGSSKRDPDGNRRAAYAVQVATALGIDWHLHIPYRPQSSGKVERVNGIIKTHLTKLASELRLSWVDLLPLALTRIRTTPHSKTGLTPFELLYGRPYLLTHLPEGEAPPLAGYLPLFSLLRSLLREHADRVLPQPTDDEGSAQPLAPGDQALGLYQTTAQHGPADGVATAVPRASNKHSVTKLAADAPCHPGHTLPLAAPVQQEEARENRRPLSYSKKAGMKGRVC
ncbi:uncharacterized protein [Muntiacus reevesi]|uniref:uncharacterized protein n=1 Tax=Muntiacus reevesi TaxID=9886 RepID=UPI003306FCC2